LDEAGCPEFIVLRTNLIFFYIVGHQPSTLRPGISGFKPPPHISLFLDEQEASQLNEPTGLL
jgi:hypothetical protein